jgi:hypothetical protein
MRRRFGGALTKWWIAAALTLVTLLATYQVPYAYAFDVGGRGDWLFLEGFYLPERESDVTYRWSSDRATLMFPGAAQNQAYELRMHLAAGSRPSTAPPATVSVTANGIPAQTFQVAPEFASYKLRLPPTVVGADHDLLIELRVPAFIPGNGDSRPLGVVVNAVHLQPIAVPPLPLALPPLYYAVAWVVNGWLWLAVLLQTPLARRRSTLAAGLVLGELVFAAGLILARAWLSALIWPIAVALVLLAFLARIPLGVARARAGESADFSPLATLGLRDVWLRRGVALVIAVVSAISFSAAVVEIFETHRLVDLFSMYTSARLLAAHGNIYSFQDMRDMATQIGGERYSTIISNTFLEHYPSTATHPPSDAFYGLRWTPFSFSEVRLLYVAETVLLYLASLLLLWLTLRSMARRRLHWVFPTALFAFFMPARLVLDDGQVTLHIFFLMLVVFWAFSRGRDGIAGIALGLNIMTKMVPGLFLIYFIWKREWRVVVFTLATIVILVLLTLPWSGINMWVEYFTRILPASSPGTGHIHNQSLAGLINRLMLGDTANHIVRNVPAVRAVSLLTTALVVTLAAYLTKGKLASRHSLRFGLEYSLWLTALTLISPISWFHYFAWLLLPITILLLALLNSSLGYARAGVIIVALVAGILLLDVPEFVSFTDSDLWQFSPLLAGGLIIFATLSERLSSMHALQTYYTPVVDDESFAL